MDEMERLKRIDEINDVLNDIEKCQYFTVKELNDMEYQKKVLERF